MSSSKRKTLGRGLSALLGDEVSIETSASVVPGSALAVPIEFLHPGKYQPRHRMDAEAIGELAASIAQKGVLQPLLVRPHPDNEGEYEIIAGERRWQASQQAQLHEVPVIIKNFSDAEALEVGLIENLQRQDLSPIEEADGYQRLMDEFHHTQEIMANVVGKSRSHIANTLRLLKLPEDIKLMVEEATLSAGHARALLGTDDPSALARKIVREGLNVRQAEKLARKSEEPTKNASKAAASSKDSDTLALERNMTALLGLQVDISQRAAGGVLSIAYKTLDQLDDVLHRLSNGPRGASSIPADAGDVSLSEDMSDLRGIFDETESALDADDLMAEEGAVFEASPDETWMGTDEESAEDIDMRVDIDTPNDQESDEQIQVSDLIGADDEAAQSDGDGLIGLDSSDDPEAEGAGSEEDDAVKISDLVDEN